MNDYTLSPLGSPYSEDILFDYGGDYSTDNNLLTENEPIDYIETIQNCNFNDSEEIRKCNSPLNEDEEEASYRHRHPFYDVAPPDTDFQGYNMDNMEYDFEINDSNDNTKLDTTNIKIKYKKEMCYKCHQKVLRNNMFVLDKCNYICIPCSVAIDDITRLSDWEEQPLGKGVMCYRCKKLKSGYRFKKVKSHLCSYCSYKQKWRNMQKN